LCVALTTFSLFDLNIQACICVTNKNINLNQILTEMISSSLSKFYWIIFRGNFFHQLNIKQLFIV